jgi:hypothetical protein
MVVAHSCKNAVCKMSEILTRKCKIYATYDIKDVRDGVSEGIHFTIL